MVNWEFNINLGTILPLIFAAGVFYAITRTDLKGLNENVKVIKEDIKMLNQAVAGIAVQNARLDSQESMIAALQRAQTISDDRIYDLSQGRGFIRQNVDGEYPKK